MRGRLALRPTIRLRLTLAYGVSFLIAGAVLLSLNYALVSRRAGRSSFGVVVQARAGAPLPGVIGAGPGAQAPAGAGVPGLQEVGLGTGVVVGESVGPVPAPGTVASTGAPDPKQLLAEAARFQSRLRRHALHTLAVQSGTALGAVALLAVGLGWLLAGRVLRPLHGITATARRLSAENLSERINMAGPRDELKELADTFDQMLGRIDAAFESQRRFVANASHELRTPLAIQRTLVDVALANPDPAPEELCAMAEGVREVTDRSERLIDSLLVLARSQRELVAKDSVNLATVAIDVLDQVRPQADELGLAVDSRLDPAPVTGDRPLLERLAGNLVENAVRHNRPGGWVRVETSADRATARLEVASTGPLVAESEVPGLFEPFRRQGEARTGSDGGVGLGLSIVRSVVAAHGGTVEARPVPGGGLAVTVRLARGG